jgi:hypothetical protein
VTDQQKAKFIELIRGGVLHDKALDDIGVTFDNYIRATFDDHDFSRQVLRAMIDALDQPKAKKPAKQALELFRQILAQDTK